MQQTSVRQRVLIAVAIALLAFGGSLSRARPAAPGLPRPLPDERLRRDVERQAADLEVAWDRLLAAQAKLEKLEAETARLLEQERKHHQEIVRTKAQDWAVEYQEEFMNPRLFL